MADTNKRALILGISGQDGAYLANFLLEKGYMVFGTSRDAQMTSFSNLEHLGIRHRVTCMSMAINDFRSVLQTVMRAEPGEIYNLAGQSSVGLSFEQPVETFESISVGNLNLLEVIRFIGKPIRLYNASSSECFGNTDGEPADERFAFRPRSPYAVAKAAAFWELANYREAYHIFACSGILFNHESPLRPERYVTRKIVKVACRIATGTPERLHLGNIDIERDWGWAPEYVEAMWRMLQLDDPEDFVVATGESHSLSSFVAEVFSALDLEWQRHVSIDAGLFRPTEIAISRANPRKAQDKLNWQASVNMAGVARRMVQAELEMLSNFSKRNSN